MNGWIGGWMDGLINMKGRNEERKAKQINNGYFHNLIIIG